MPFLIYEFYQKVHKWLCRFYSISSCFSSHRLIFYNQTSNNDWFFMSRFTMKYIYICNRLHLCCASDIGRRQEVKNRQDGSECYIILWTSEWTICQWKSCHLKLLKITYSLSLHESYQLWYFDFEQYFICIILDTRHRENLQNRGTGNPYQNQNTTWTGMRRMAFQCRQWYRMELWEPLMEHRGAPVANISVATEGRRVL